MDHQEIQRSDMIDRYLAGRITEEEASRFEEHLLECPGCLEQVRWAEDFQDAVRAAATREQAQAALAVQAGLLRWLVRRSQAERRALLLAASLLVAAPPAWLLWRQGDLERELSLAQAAQVRAEQQVREAASRPPVQARVPVAPPAAAAAGSAGPAASILAADRQRLEEDLRREREASARLQEQLQRLSRPQAAALVALGFVRSGAGEGQAIRVGRSGGLVLSVELPAGAEPAYRATLRGVAGQVLWRGDRLQTGMDETLLISFPPGFLRPGSYRLQLEALPREGGLVPAGELPFQILPPG